MSPVYSTVPFDEKDQAKRRGPLGHHAEASMTFQCYVPRSSKQSTIGAIFVSADGLRRLIPDHWLAQAKLSEQRRLLRLIYTCCTIEVAGQHLEVLFEDAAAGRLGTICQGPPGPVPRDQLWVSSLVAVAPAEAVSALESESLRC